MWDHVRRGVDNRPGVAERGAAYTGAGGAVNHSEIDLAEYRERVDDVAGQVAAHPLPGSAASLPDRLADDPVIAAVLRHHPIGIEHALTLLRRELTSFVPNSRSSASDHGALVRIFLLHQIDVLWWGSMPRYETSADVLAASDLVDLEPLRKAGALRFRYSRQPTTLTRRVERAARRRLLPRVAPLSAGLRYTRARPEGVALLNRLADELTAQARHPRAGVWLNSAVRSGDHQEHLRSLGYSALDSSSHCSGY
ncbi:MAG: hypothetical protein ABI251_08590, partial [Mycobacteriaceae bacterium]